MAHDWFRFAGIGGLDAPAGMPLFLTAAACLPHSCFPRMEAMLILTRKAGEKLQIGDDITVTVTRVDKHCVKIGIEAPADVSIMRGELLAEIRSTSLADQPV